MIREEAIEILENTTFIAPLMVDVDTALDMAISALSADGDLISRQAVLNTLDFADNALTDEVRTVENFKALLTECIKVLPSAENKGEWIDEGFYADGHSQHAYRCSECGEHYIGYVGEFMLNGRTRRYRGRL